MDVERMNEIQRRLHNAACVLGADGDEYGFEQLQRDAIAEIERLRVALAKIADWDSIWGPFPENNEAWRAMVVVTAREAVPLAPRTPEDNPQS